MTQAPPVAIGALGGSGTRVYARVLQELDISIGPWLNGALDNLVFTALFKEPSLAGPLASEDLQQRITTFVRFMAGEPLDPNDAALLSSMEVPGEPVDVDQLLGEQRTPGPWGWKEPNTQLFLDPLIDGIDGLRYIHVMRHGLDMAFSANVNQLRNFGGRFGLPLPLDPEQVPVVQLDYWIASTRSALDIAAARLPGRHLVSRFDDLCDDPDDELTRMLEFLNAEVSRERLDQMRAMVEVPSTKNRYHDEDLSRFRPDQLDAVEALGFAIQPKTA